MGRLDLEEFEREISLDDDSAAAEILAQGRPIHIWREGTPAGYVIRICPDGREELTLVDDAKLAETLGR
jgi:hypothetical protein